MIVETIISWFFSVLSEAISLLPSLGHTLDLIPANSLGFVKIIGIVNGYLPISELGIAFVVCLGVFSIIWIAKLIYVAFNFVAKIIP